LLRTILSGVLVAVCGAMPVAAQAARPRPQAPKPAQASVQAAPTETVIDATDLGSSLALDRGWRVGISSDPAVALPDFDDSKWAIRNATDSFADVPDHGATNDSGPRLDGRRQPTFVWFRLHVKLAEDHGPLALLVELPVAQGTQLSLSTLGPDVFANGKQIQPEGPHGDAPSRYQPISRIYNLNLPPGETSLTLVLRTIYVPLGFSAYTNFFATHNLRLGNPADLESSLELWSARTLFERLPRLVNNILLTVLALFLLVLFFTQKGHMEYLWLALYELLQAPIGAVELAGNSAHLDHIWYMALFLQLLAISAYLYFEFLIAFLALRRRWYIQALRFSAVILAGIAPSLLMVGHSSSAWAMLALVGTGSSVWIMGWLLFIFITLIVATLRRNFEAGLLLIPLLLTMVGIVEPVLTAGMTDWTGHPYRSPLTIEAGPIPIHFAIIADFAGMLAIVIIIFGRFLRIQREQEHASSELAAARSVQELMIPREKVETPGYEVDSVYNPANEVGGDFFHVQAVDGGGLLVVIGDVAGKGLKAAMNVSMLMGALRKTAETHPAKILASLNRVLAGSESFTTCQAAFFGADGELVLANAGHLPPYLNSQEVATPGGLPLGVLADANYDEVRLYMHPGDRLLLLSDGVAEARQPTGELFGFSRVHNLSNQTAFYIADAAKSFGQEDDITVLTVRRLEQAMVA
jgi:hypothetical protein